MSIYIVSIFAIFMVSIIVLSVKNHLVYRHTQRAIQYIFKQDDWATLRSIYLKDDGYFSLVLNPRMWTYRQMFKGLED